VGRDEGGAALTDPLRVLLAGPVVPAAKALLGSVVSSGGVSVRLTEVEAYDGVGRDAASHAHRGRTPRNGIMFGPAGYAYVYFTYGMHWCLNVVCGQDGIASAVLLRAGEVTAGHDIARARRPGVRDRDLARGPARLTMTLGLDGTTNGVDLLDPAAPVRLSPAEAPARSRSIHSGPRVGVTGEPDRPWRFWIAGEATVTTYRRHVVRRRPGPSESPR
jgi:DNA-3-methyladenine glycosylase